MSENTLKLGYYQSKKQPGKFAKVFDIIPWDIDDTRDDTVHYYDLDKQSKRPLNYTFNYEMVFEFLAKWEWFDEELQPEVQAEYDRVRQNNYPWTGGLGNYGIWF